jgi:fructose-bisphosphate aldolase class II
VVVSPDTITLKLIAGETTTYTKMKFSAALFASVVLGSGAADAFTAGVKRSAKVSSVSLRETISEELGTPCEDECALDSFPNLPPSVHPGVVSGQAMLDLLDHAKENGYAIPAVNCVSSSGINACLEAARKNDAPIIIQFSSGGSQFYGGKGLSNKNYAAAIAGAVSGAFHVRTMAEQYGIPVILHTDHCAKNLLPWVDGLLAASERYYAKHGEPLFSSHMIDLSEEPIEENIEICKDYLTRFSKIGMLLEMELGITGGEEDGVNNEDVALEDLYSKPEEILPRFMMRSPPFQICSLWLLLSEMSMEFIVLVMFNLNLKSSQGHKPTLVRS